MSAVQTKRFIPETDGAMLQCVLVTGANSGLGLETCRQLADQGASKVILGCRSEDKAKAAISKLVALTGKNVFEMLVIDVSDSKSSLAAAETLNHTLDGIVLNAGGMSFGVANELTTDGVTNIFAQNVLGHAIFLERVISLGKLSEGAAVVYAGTEAASGAAKMMKIPVVAFEQPLEESILSYIDGSSFIHQKHSYGVVKSIAALYISAMATKHPEYFFMTVSPGMVTSTAFTSKAKRSMRIMLVIVKPIAKLLRVSHSVEKGAGRYMTALLTTTQLGASGSFYASKTGKVSGELVDQSIDFPYYSDSDHHSAAYNAIHKFI